MKQSVSKEILGLFGNIDPEELPLQVLIAMLNAEGQPYAELRADVEKLLDPLPMPAKAQASGPRGYWLSAVAKKIDRMNFKRTRIVLRLQGKPRDTRNRLRLGNEWFFFTDMPRPKLKGDAGEREQVYWLLDMVLRGGEFAQVRRCEWCKKYFATTRSDRLVCSAECNWKRQNAKRKSTEDKLSPDTLARWEAREKQFDEAKKMKEQGRTFIAIKNKTGLSERVFNKELAGRGLVELLKLERAKESQKEKGKTGAKSSISSRH